MRGIKAIFNKRGSSVIMVLIAMAFISILGTILMFAAFTGYQIKAAQTLGERAFYNAEAALDEVRAGVQEIVTDSIAGAYTQMLLEYAHDEDLEKIFMERFEEYLRDWRRDCADCGPVVYDAECEPFITLNTYNGALLESFITGDGITASFIGAVELIEEEDEDTFERTLTALILRGIRIEHRSDIGYVSRVTTDIIVIIPDFSYVRADYPISEIALIATDLLEVDATYASIDDSIAYAGSVLNTGTLVINGGTFISGGDIVTLGAGVHGNLTVNGALWANRIIIGNDIPQIALTGTFALNGEAYIRDDLVLQGAGASATLDGSYFGFGASPNIATESSSIIVNGMNSTLNMNDLRSLFLAGHSFIHPGEGPQSILTGQSLSTKGDQLFYLLPPDAITINEADALAFNVIGENPFLFSGDTPPRHDVDLSEVTWVADGSTKTLGDYRMAIGQNLVTGQRSLYFFMGFDDVADANDYFSYYFSEYPEEIDNNIRRYLGDTSNNLTLFGAPDDPRTAGSYYYREGNVPRVGSPVGDLAAASRINTMFNNITRTLSSSVSPDGSLSTFEHVVRIDRVADLTDAITTFEHEGEIVAVIINDGSEHSVGTLRTNYGSGINLVISTGNVIINEPVTGMVISDGTVTLSSTITSAGDTITSLLSARNPATGNTLGWYTKFRIVDDAHLGDDVRTHGWDLSELVSFANWSKR
jgi:phage baseplate assembly protein gpV